MHYRQVSRFCSLVQVNSEESIVIQEHWKSPSVFPMFLSNTHSFPGQSETYPQTTADIRKQWGLPVCGRLLFGSRSALKKIYIDIDI